MTHSVEALIIGAGVIGSSVAMHLAQLGMSNVRVLDFDLEGSLSSTELNAGGVRATWREPIHIEMSQISINYFSQVAQEVGYRPCGYLWLHTPETWSEALKARERQVAMGWPVEIWDVAEVRRKIPFLDKTDDLEGALFGPRDGLINSNLLKNHYRERAKSLGVIFDDRMFLSSIQLPQKAGGAVSVNVNRFRADLTLEEKKAVLTHSADAPTLLEQVRYAAQRVVNCAGPWAGKVAERLGYVSPAYPMRRQICLFDGREMDLTPYGMIVDTSGIYFHPEASYGLAGLALPGEPKHFDYTYEGADFFQNHIWPALYERASVFEKLKHVTGWSGLYEVSPDEAAILGPVCEGPLREQLFEAHSFSGHGVMHSYAAGLALAEKMVKGRYETVDVSSLSASRFTSGKLLHETEVI